MDGCAKYPQCKVMLFAKWHIWSENASAAKELSVGTKESTHGTKELSSGAKELTKGMDIKDFFDIVILRYDH